MTSKKKKTKTEINKNKNVNKNNINITINHPKKKSSKKRSTGATKQSLPSSTSFSPTIINQIPNITPPENLNKYAYEYNAPSKPKYIEIPIKEPSSIKTPIKNNNTFIPGNVVGDISVMGSKQSLNKLSSPYSDSYSSLSDSNSEYYSAKTPSVLKKAYAFYDSFSDQMPMAYADFSSSDSDTNQNMLLQRAFKTLKSNKRQDENKGVDVYNKSLMKKGMSKFKTYDDGDFGVTPENVEPMKTEPIPKIASDNISFNNYEFENQVAKTFTPNDRRETILNPYNEPSQSFELAPTPDVTQQKRYRRSNAQMDEIRQEENKKAEDLLAKLKNMNKEAKKRDYETPQKIPEGIVTERRTIYPRKKRQPTDLSAFEQAYKEQNKELEKVKKEFNDSFNL